LPSQLEAEKSNLSFDSSLQMKMRNKHENFFLSDKSSVTFLPFLSHCHIVTFVTFYHFHHHTLEAYILILVKKNYFQKDEYKNCKDKLIWKDHTTYEPDPKLWQGEGLRKILNEKPESFNFLNIFFCM